MDGWRRTMGRKGMREIISRRVCERICLDCIIEKWQSQNTVVFLFIEVLDQKYLFSFLPRDTTSNLFGPGSTAVWFWKSPWQFYARV
jgi:hypothetical protein